jgi:predicted kinase/predicted HD phosphohydrolase
MVGLPASGKSYQADIISKANNANIHSSDKIREELTSDINCQDVNKEVFELLHKRIKADLYAGKNTIYDATNIDYKKRMAFLDEIKDIDCKKICLFMATPYKDCLYQNANRERNIPEYVIKKMYLNFFVPQYYEGWDKIEICWNFKENEYNLGDLFNGKNGLNKISHDNPHHTLTIGQHCYQCSIHLEEMYKGDAPIELFESALMHDIGKPFTKSFKNSKDEITDVAHYYQHHLVSAYDSLFYSQGLGNELKRSNYIQWHMQPHFWEKKSQSEMYKKLWGEGFYNNLMLLHKADEMAR